MGAQLLSPQRVQVKIDESTTGRARMTGRTPQGSALTSKLPHDIYMVKRG